MKRIAKDLAEIAVEFDKRADAATRWAEGAKAAADRRAAEVEARVWAEAAAVLRETELQP